MSDQLPNPFKGIESAGISETDAPGFAAAYGWVSDRDDLRGHVREFFEEMWSVAYAHGRAQGQVEAGTAATARAEELLARLDQRTGDLQAAQRIRKSHQADIETLKTHVAVRDEWLKRRDCELASRDEKISALTAELRRIETESKVGFRVWWRLSRVTAVLHSTATEKVASYGRD